MFRYRPNLNKTAKTEYNYELAKTNLIYIGTNFKNNNCSCKGQIFEYYFC